MLGEIDVLLALMAIASFLVAIPLHEWSHAVVASWLGDSSPRSEGRQSLRLRAHVDPVGTLLCVILAFQSAVGLGWGQPVVPDPWKMRVRNKNTGVLLVAIAGPIFSLLVGLIVAAITGILTRALANFLTVNTISTILTAFVLKLLVVFACVNVTIALFNIIPLYPLDGYQILYTLLPDRQAVQFQRSSTYGPFILLAIFFFVPFLAQLARLTFDPEIWIRDGAFSLMALVSGMPFAEGFSLFFQLYRFGQGVFS
jgi:Zn-dependent protease